MPHASENHVDSALSTFISGYSNGEYYADVVSPLIETKKTSDVYQKFYRRDATTYQDDLIGPDGMAGEGDYGITTGTFVVEQRAKKGVVTSSEIANADEPHHPFEQRSMHLMNQILLGREMRVAAQLLATGSYASGNYASASTLWSNESTGTPLTNLQTARAAIAPGSYGNSKIVGICALEVFQALSKHPQMLGGGSQSAALTKEQICSLVGMDELLVSDAQKQTANPGQTAAFARIWTATQFVMVRVPTSSPRGTAGLFAATFRYTGDGAGLPVRVRRWETPERGFGGSETVQVELADDEVVVQNDQGYLLSSVL